jgi:3-oxoacyl-[acyl-carrier protein] reductase
MGRLNKKVAIVTGASKGIGAGIARALAAEGASVVLNYASSKEDAERVVAEIVAKDGRAVAVSGDMGKREDVVRLFAETVKAFGGVDILVNNAGVYRFDAIETVAEQEFDRQFHTNVLGPLLTIQEAQKHFKQGGTIINVGSVISTARMPSSVVYTATKAALDAVTRVLAVELGPRNIRINSLNPGPVDTEGARTAGVIGSDLERNMAASTPFGRIGQPEDIAKVAVFLASPEASWITGETIAVSGGFR